MIGRLARSLVALLVVALLLVAAVVVVGTYTFLPPFFERAVAQDVQDRLGLRDSPEVDLTSDPPPRMLRGTFSGGSVEIPGVSLGGVRPENVAVDLDPFGVDAIRSVRGGRMVAETTITGDLRVELSEREVSRVVQENATEFPVTGVQLSGGRALVESEAQVFGIRVPVGVEGEPVVRDGSLVFEPREVIAAGNPVPENLAAGFLEGRNFSYPLDDNLPRGLDGGITGARIEGETLVLSGSVDLPV